MKRVLALLLASIVGVLVVTRRWKARDSSDLWAEATRALQTPPSGGHAPVASG